MNQSSPGYSDRLVELYGGPAGKWNALEIREFDDDMEARDLFDDYMSQIEEAFAAALKSATALWGPPSKRFDWMHDEADDWLGRTVVSFIEIALWPLDGDQYFYLLYSHEDRECPILLVAGVTDGGAEPA